MKTRAELASLAANIPGYTGTLHDLIRDTLDVIADPTEHEALDLLSVWARVGDETNGLLK